MSRETLIALVGGVFSALAAMSAFLAGSPGAVLFVYLAPLPLLLVGLGFGVTAVLIACASGLLFAGLLGGLFAGSLYALIHAIPAWLVVHQAMIVRPGANGTPQWTQAGTILCRLTAMVGAVFLITAVYASSGEGGIRILVSEYLDVVVMAVLPTISEAGQGDIVALLTPTFPGMIGSFWVLITVLNAFLAQSILLRMGRNRRPKITAAALELPDWISWLLVGAAAMALLGTGEIEYIGRNLVLILVLPFFLLGLVVAHFLARRVTFPGMLLTAFYLFLLFSKWTVFAVVGVGLIEQWFGLRKRFPGPGSASGV